MRSATLPAVSRACALAVMAWSCSRTEPRAQITEAGAFADSAPTAQAAPSTAASSALAVPPNALDDFELSVVQTPCFGPCPVYALHVDAAGHVKAGRTVSAERATKTLTHDDLVRLAKAFYDAGFFDFADVYPSQATDASTTILELRSAGRTKKVTHSHSNRDAPAALFDLEKVVEDVTGAVGAGALRPMPLPAHPR